jgi:hypothetical protein
LATSQAIGMAADSLGIAVGTARNWLKVAIVLNQLTFLVSVFGKVDDVRAIPCGFLPPNYFWSI